MSWIARNLWELLSPPKPKRKDPVSPPSRSRPRVEQAPKPRRAAGNGRTNEKSAPMQQRYDALVREMKSTYGIRIRKWRKSSSGCAWELRDVRTGEVTRLLESPYPRGPMSCAIFLHEVGHHAIGFRTYRPRCLEEYHAWRWSLEMMERKGFNITDSVRRRMHESLHYAVAKAARRGLKRLPIELEPYLAPPPRRARA